MNGSLILTLRVVIGPYRSSSSQLYQLCWYKSNNRLIFYLLTNKGASLFSSSLLTSWTPRPLKPPSFSKTTSPPFALTVSLAKMLPSVLLASRQPPRCWLGPTFPQTSSNTTFVVCRPAAIKNFGLFVLPSWVFYPPQCMKTGCFTPHLIP